MGRVSTVRRYILFNEISRARIDVSDLDRETGGFRTLLYADYSQNLFASML